MWSHCVLSVLTSGDCATQWAPSGEALLSHSHITLGQWKDRILQLQDLSAVLWDNMGIATLAEFRYSEALKAGNEALVGRAPFLAFLKSPAKDFSRLIRSPFPSAGRRTFGSRAPCFAGSCRAWLTCCLRAYRKATWKVVRVLWRIPTLS